MKEEFLHFIWKYGLYDASRLKDSNGNNIIVIQPGEYNRDAGPDFFNSRVRIGDTEWAGNVEIHIKSSHFETHGHHRDHAFDNVILHVVSVNDKRTRNARGREIPTLEISCDEAVSEKYTELLSNPATIACENHLESIDKFFINQWLQALMVERLESKCSYAGDIFKETGNDWDETFYRLLSRYFGFRVNTDPFELMARALPFRLIRKHADNPFQVEALLFGTAGMLDEGLFRNTAKDSYYNDLAREFRMLKAKYSISPVHGWLWKFGRLRPVNFPTVRISQLAAMLGTAGGLFSRVISTGSITELRKLFEVSASEYWADHYIFGKKSPGKSRATGDASVDLLLINAVIPVIFFYGRVRGEPALRDRALDLLDAIDAENNAIIRDWITAGIDPVSASDSQALLQLRLEYCRKRRCLDCRIGTRIITCGWKLKLPEQTILEP
ncbi:MAG: DUF2851 family protein [Bacteroidales bacterium]